MRRVFIVVVNDLVRSIPHILRKRVLHQKNGY
jgi:hypothetical protein